MDQPIYSTVLVTGANSFYAAAIMDKLVVRGIKIHATVRSPATKKPLQIRYSESIKVFIVSDMTHASAFRDAIKGCGAIFHVASPLCLNFSDAKSEFLDPAIQGATAILQAASQEPGVRRVVLTSSIAACIDPIHPDGILRPGYTYTEADWNPLTYEAAASYKVFPPVYTASKALAEKAAWEFMEAEPRSFRLVCINPCHTWGSYKQHVSSPKSMNFTNADLARLMDGEERDVPPTKMPWMTGIDEVAQAHVNALLKSEASGRYIIANAPYDFQQVVDFMHENFTDAPWIGNVPRGRPGQKAIGEHFSLDNRRSREQLGVVYRDWTESIRDFCTQYAVDRESWASK